MTEGTDAMIPEEVVPIDMLLYCPSCGYQHVDAPSDGWTNPPHKSHLCHECKTIWRPADVPTNGVIAINTKGSADNWFPFGRAHAALSAAGVGKLVEALTAARKEAVLFEYMKPLVAQIDSALSSFTGTRT